MLEGEASFGARIDIRVWGPGTVVGTVVATGTVVVACGGATFVVVVDGGAGARVVDVVDEVDEEEVVEEVVVDGGGSVVVVAGAEVTGDDVVVWARARPAPTPLMTVDVSTMDAITDRAVSRRTSTVPLCAHLFALGWRALAPSGATRESPAAYRSGRRPGA